MSGFLTRLSERSLGLAPVARPRPPSRFEPTPEERGGPIAEAALPERAEEVPAARSAQGSAPRASSKGGAPVPAEAPVSPAEHTALPPDHARPAAPAPSVATAAPAAAPAPLRPVARRDGAARAPRGVETAAAPSIAPAFSPVPARVPSSAQSFAADEPAPSLSPRAHAPAEASERRTTQGPRTRVAKAPTAAPSISANHDAFAPAPERGFGPAPRREALPERDAPAMRPASAPPRPAAPGDATRPAAAAPGSVPVPNLPSPNIVPPSAPARREGAVEVVIGRLEVRVPPPPAPARPAQPAGLARVPSLKDYLGR